MPDETLTMSIREAAKSVPVDVELMRSWVYAGLVRSVPVSKPGAKTVRRRPLRSTLAADVAAITSGKGSVRPRS